MTQRTENVFAVEVPEEAKSFDFEIDAKEDWYQLTYLLMIDDEDSGFYGEDEQHSIDIPPGNWQLLCTTRTCTPNQAREITGEEYYPSIALAGMLKGKGLDESKNYCLIEKL